MTARVLIFWVLSITALFCCFFISLDKTNSTVLKPKNITSLLKVEPHSFYYSKNKYHANITGRLKIEIKTETLSESLLHYNVLIIEGLEIDLNTTISLNWNLDNQPHQTPLNSNKQSINLMDFNTTDSEKISNLHLLISSNFELGTRPNAQKDVAFTSIYFDSTQNHSPVSIKINEWLDYTPIKFNSINGYSSSDNLHFKTLIQRLAIWALIILTLFLLLSVSGNHLIACLSLAWLITLIPFSINFVKQNHQIKSAFTNDKHYLNRQDITSYELAQKITAKIKTVSSIDLSQQKFIIVGNNDFYHLRLYHHLINFNVAINNSDLFSLLKNDSSKQYIYILTKKHIDHCNRGTESIDSLTEIIGQETQYCLMRKI